jgi:uncharacterized membrane protein
MNIVLWIVQILLAVAFLLTGVNHAFRTAQIRSQQGMSWVAAVPSPLMTFIGISEILGALGLVLPALTGAWTWLTPLAALGLAIIQALAIGFHVRRNETQNIIANFILLVLAAFVAYGRWIIVPF